MSIARGASIASGVPSYDNWSCYADVATFGKGPP